MFGSPCRFGMQCDMEQPTGEREPYAPATLNQAKFPPIVPGCTVIRLQKHPEFR
jgi:hypothetical protein